MSETRKEVVELIEHLATLREEMNTMSEGSADVSYDSSFESIVNEV